MGAKDPEIPVERLEDQVNLGTVPIIKAVPENQVASGVGPYARSRLIRIVLAEGEEGAVDHRPGLVVFAPINDLEPTVVGPILATLRFESGNQYTHDVVLQ
jgi:hypothetical protein